MLKKTKDSSYYRLKPITNQSSNSARQLCKIMQTSLQKAVDDGQIHQVRIIIKSLLFY